MSKYTTEVRWIVEETCHHAPENTPLDSIDDKIDYAAPLIFNFKFPVWVDEYKPTLLHKILMHYYLREIAFETVGLWKYWLNRRLNEIMPYYNELYKTTVRDFDYMTDTYISETIHRDRKDDANAGFTEDTKGNNAGSGQSAGEDNAESNGENHSNVSNTGSTTHETNGTSKNLISDMPATTESQQLGSDYYANQIQKGETGSKDVQTDDTKTQNYTTSKNISTNNNTSNYSNESSFVNNRGGTSTNSLTSGEDTVLARWGNSGGKSPTELLQQFRDSLLNIDMMVIKDLSDLFFTLY